MNPMAIEVEHLTKAFQAGKKVVDDISFSIPTGSIFGFLGPNGAGKTTTIRLLNGIFTPTGGKASICGLDVVKDSLAIRSKCGVMTETASLYGGLSAIDNIMFFARLQGLSKPDAEASSFRLMTQFDLWEHKDKKVQHFSTGMRKKLSLAVAIIHKPSVLFLDEPTSGLDPEAARDVTALIKKMAVEENVTVFLCTHQLKFFEETCNLYGFIHDGRMLGFGTFQELLQKKKGSVSLEIRGSDLPGPDSNLLRLPIKDDGEAAQKISEIAKGGAKIFDARQVHWDLEDLYFSYQKNNHGEVQA